MVAGVSGELIQSVAAAAIVLGAALFLGRRALRLVGQARRGAGGSADGCGDGCGCGEGAHRGQPRPGA